MLNGFEDKSAYVLSIFAYGEPGKEVKLFVGKTDDTIVEPRGSKNFGLDTKKFGMDAKIFGWDPCFQALGFNQTYAEMSKDAKNAISQRFKSIDSRRKHFNSL
jgi:inosine triphosphate pyrophosphatase